MNKKIKTEAVDFLFDAILSLQNREECYTFFEDVCTIKEMKDMAQRLEVAALLHAGQSYQQICAKTGASTATIGRVNKCLNYGTGGYRRALEKTDAKD